MQQAKMQPIKTNLINGSYRPKFFDFEEFNLSEAILESKFYSDEEVNPELTIVKKDYSFCYLREDKLKLIHLFTKEGKKISHNEFLQHVGIELNSSNLFKTGKYLSRVFRPVRYGGFFYDVDVFIQTNKSIEHTDGISLISLKLAKALGWKEAKHGMSGQFTLFNKQGLVKGHCVVSERIKHDVIIYGNENIKTEIQFNYKGNLSYLSIEPVKLSRTLRLDIQSMLNLWGLFGAEQYLNWTHKAIMQYKEDLLSGKINDWLKDDDNPMDSEDECWVLKKAINAGLDYRQFPYLFRKAWSIFRNSIYNFAENNKNEPIFRIPVPNGIRAYIRIDLRNHKPNGYFKSRISKDEIYIDRSGNAYFSEEGFQRKMKILGGADQDDSLAIIPLEDDKAVIYRNPNQFGEFLIVNIKYDKEIEEIINRTERAKQVGRVPIKKIKKEPKLKSNSTNNNPLIRSYLKSLPREEGTKLEYTTSNLLKSFTRIIKNTANIGYASNAEMILSAIRISNKKVFNELRKEYAWNLEKIIDGTVKEGTDLTDEILKVKSLLEIATTKYYNLIPKSLHYRLPDKLRKEDKPSTNHKLDFLLEAIKFITEQMDLELTGKGTISQGNRIQGMIDRLNIPIERIIIDDEYNQYYSVAMDLLQEYNMSVAEALKLEDRLEHIPEIKKQFLIRLNEFPRQIRKQIIQAIAV